MRTLDGYVDEYLGVKIYQGHNPQSKVWPLNNNHEELPYGFKPTAIQECRERDFPLVIWMDSTVRLLKDPQIYIDYAKEHGVCAFENLGHEWRKYTSDIAVKQLGVEPSEMDAIKNIMACVLIFCFENPVGKGVFDEWIRISRDGVTFHNGYGSERPEFIAHRHDQSALAALLYRHKVPVLPYGGLAYGDHAKTQEYGPVTFLNRGIE
jgi:hypothetical protein